MLLPALLLFNEERKKLLRSRLSGARSGAGDLIGLLIRIMAAEGIASEFLARAIDVQYQFRIDGRLRLE